MWAAMEGRLEVVKYLVQEAGADKDKADKVRAVGFNLLCAYNEVDAICG
jgi:hypothetical protein